MTSLLRPVLYAVCALGGVYVAAQLQPVKLDTGAAVKASSFDLGELAGDLFSGNWSELKKDVTGSAAKGAANATAQVQGQVQNIVITGVVGGCLVAGLIDLVALS